MRPIQIIQVSEMEILIHDDEEFLMHLLPRRVETAGRDFVGLTQPERYWLKLIVEHSPGGYGLWLRQEPRSTNGTRSNGALINSIGQLIEWDDAVRARLALANEMLAKSTQYVVAWMNEHEAYYGAVHPDIGWIKSPDRVTFIARRAINDREGWESLLEQARTNARQLGIAHVQNLDPDPV